MNPSKAPEKGDSGNRNRLNERIGVSEDIIVEFCKRWGVCELAFFGSILRDDFGPDSDIDILIKFGTDRTPGLLGLVRMQRELTEMLGRNVDIVTRNAIEYSRNPIRRRAVLDSAQVYYAAG